MVLYIVQQEPLPCSNRICTVTDTPQIKFSLYRLFLINCKMAGSDMPLTFPFTGNTVTRAVHNTAGATPLILQDRSCKYYNRLSS